MTPTFVSSNPPIPTHDGEKEGEGSLPLKSRRGRRSRRRIRSRRRRRRRSPSPPHHPHFDDDRHPRRHPHPHPHPHPRVSYWVAPHYASTYAPPYASPYAWPTSLTHTPNLVEDYGTCSCTPGSATVVSDQCNRLAALFNTNDGVGREYRPVCLPDGSCACVDTNPRRTTQDWGCGDQKGAICGIPPAPLAYHFLR